MNTREMTTEELLRMRDEEIDFSDIPESEADFFPSCFKTKYDPYLRLAFGYASLAQIREGIPKLAECVMETQR